MRPKPPLNLLAAFPYFKGSIRTIMVDNRDKIRLLIDSGAYTAFKQGLTIDLDDYCKFLETLPVEPWRYFMLDVIGQPEATMRNYKTMLRRGLRPVPVFTRGMAPAILEEMFETSDLVAIGGLVGTKNNRGFVNGIMTHVGDRAVHLLGFSDIQFLKTYRPSSCDSTGWDQGTWGRLYLYMGAGRFSLVPKDDAIKGTLAEHLKVRLLHYGVDPALLRLKSAWEATEGMAYKDRPAHQACCRGYVDAARDIELNLGTKYFFASTSNLGFKNLIAAWERMQ